VSEDEMVNTHVTRDEFGGYCCKRIEPNGDANFEENICKLLGIDIERKALEIVMKDLGKRGVPIGALAFNTPHATVREPADDLFVSTPSTKTQPFTPLPKSDQTSLPTPNFPPRLKLGEIRPPAPDSELIKKLPASTFEPVSASKSFKEIFSKFQKKESGSSVSSLSSVDMHLLDAQQAEKSDLITPFEPEERSFLANSQLPHDCRSLNFIRPSQT
jgi:hypothetical protein